MISLLSALPSSCVLVSLAGEGTAVLRVAILVITVGSIITIVRAMASSLRCVVNKRRKRRLTRDSGIRLYMNTPVAQPATSTWCQGLVLFAREEAKRLLPIHCARRGRRRRTNGSEGHQTEPFTWLPAERYFSPLLKSIGAYQRYTCRSRAVCDAQRQKLLLSGDIEQNPGPIAVLQMNVSCLTPSKLATLMAQEADIIAIQETWKSSEQIASMHTGDYVLYAQSRIGKGGGVAVLVRKLSAPSVYLSPLPQP
ncbi:trans-sialidase [Trypanosoma cruzi]|nr:trans-sialidase [Trypanosoma cruzi]